ncbi:hypothetical protein CPB83DRAFT_857019 [Crepidotus variabilis]|uniref:CSN8/PSMD8/EIF3K domain-containing protein n=1 Tax=Crepidotus variabilis TaxID=179855 RepID=A0A9P6JNV8_9AGAR|nr:hypothetical protein CPB83DRAFT_857019 [Crepidotus variabilis]
MTGPPTPPATSPIEFQDQARSNAAEQAQVQVQAQSASAVPAAAPSASSLASYSDNRPEIYQNAIPDIINAIKINDFTTLVQITEELDFTTASDRQPSRLLVVAPLVLGYLILDNTSAAKYALLRLSDNLLNVGLSCALQSLVVATSNREHAKVYDQANALHKLVSQEIPDKEFASIIITLLSAFIEGFRRRTFELLSKAYTSLPVQLACVYLDWPEAGVVKVAERQGWTCDPSTKTFSPQLQPAMTRQTGASSFSSLDTFHFVADSVARLEV